MDNSEPNSFNQASSPLSSGCPTSPLSSYRRKRKPLATPSHQDEAQDLGPTPEASDTSRSTMHHLSAHNDTQRASELKEYWRKQLSPSAKLNRNYGEIYNELY